MRIIERWTAQTTGESTRGLNEETNPVARCLNHTHQNERRYIQGKVPVLWEDSTAYVAQEIRAVVLSQDGYDRRMDIQQDTRN
jgi:hypothetical protein